MTNLAQVSPLIKQYFEIKKQYPDTILLFQVGDFYELFFDDAKRAASLLGIMLTTRGTDHKGDPIPLCGVPLHVLNNYLSKLVKAGFKVAICNQDEQKTGKIISRSVAQVLTPGTLTDSQFLDDKSASYLSIIFPEISSVSIITVEILTGQVFVTNLSNEPNLESLIESELSKFLPDEILLPQTKLATTHITWLQKKGFNLTIEPFDANTVELELHNINEWIKEQFSNVYKNIENNSSFNRGLQLLYIYLKRNNPRALSQLKQLFIYKPNDFLILDANTINNLELIRNSHDNTSNNTLFSLIDNASTGMGSRTLKKWLLRPLVKKELIEQRLDAVEFLSKQFVICKQLKDTLKNIKDLERIIGRIALRKTQFNDYILLLQALETIPALNEISLNYPQNNLLHAIQSKISDFSNLVNLLKSTLNDDINKEWIIKSGFNKELDRLRNLLDHGAQAILDLEKHEQQRTGISSLKIRFNGSHGYGIEVTKPNLHLVPSDFIKTQSLVNKDRFTNAALKDLEYDLNRSKTSISEIEKELFIELKNNAEIHISALKKLAYAISYFDALSSLGHLAYTRQYVRPQFNDSKNINIQKGKHPVIESLLPSTFISNDTELNDNKTLWIITGPNMGGKSTYLRQVASISILAQIGSFVPAELANLFIVDRIFTRIGASDNSTQGKSTFLVEMEETALICNQATENSLVILDEVGRGTSTYDGLAIAQAVIEYIYTNIKARCLFATHYHELAPLAEKFNNIALYYAASTKTNDGIVLLHKILPGVAESSFGLEVAKQVKLPETLLDRASEILDDLLNNKPDNHIIPTELNPERNKFRELSQKNRELELLLSQLQAAKSCENKIAQELRDIDCDNVTAKQALDILCRLKEYTR